VFFEGIEDGRRAMAMMAGDDIFDACLNLEQTYFEKGYEEGRREGRVLGRDEGRILGIKEGWDIGFELGVYLGIAEALRSSRQVGAGTSTVTTGSVPETAPASRPVRASGALGTASERKLARLVDGVYDSLMASSLGSGRPIDEANMQRGDVHPRNEEMQAYVQDVRAKFKMIAALVGDEDRRRIDEFIGVLGQGQLDF